jgi:hypothetical protein
VAQTVSDFELLHLLENIMNFAPVCVVLLLKYSSLVDDGGSQMLSSKKHYREKLRNAWRM